MLGALIILMSAVEAFAQAPTASPATRKAAPIEASSPAALLSLITRTVKEPESAARTARLGRLADQLDRLPDTELDTKIQGHFKLQVVDATVIRHATWLIASAKTWDAATRKTHAARLVDTYIELAQALADDGDNDEALALLRRVPTDLPDVPRASRHVSGVLRRLEPIGTMAAPLTAPHWLNMPPGTTSLDLKGNVTLIEFSAHWCGPCTQSYSALNRFRAAYGARGFQVAIATELYGYFGAAKDLTPEAELGRDRTYFARHKLDVPVAIRNQVTSTFDGETTTYSPARDPNHLNYRIGGLPQFYLLDRHGRIRFTLFGYGSDSEKKIATLIRRLLDEK